VLRPEDKASYGRAVDPLPTFDPPPPEPPAETFAQMEARHKQMRDAAKKEGLPNPFDHEIWAADDDDGSDDKFVHGVPLPLDIMDKYGIVDPTDERQRVHLAAKAAPPPAKPRAKRARPIAPGAASPPRTSTASKPRGRAQVNISLADDERSILDSLAAESRLTRAQVIGRLLINSVGRPTADVLFPRSTSTT